MLRPAFMKNTEDSTGESSLHRSGQQFPGNTLQFQSPSKNNQCESVSAQALPTEKGVKA